MTITDIKRVHPTERTVAQWAVLVDWDLQRTRQYVIVDPMDPSGLLYLNHAEYLSQMKVCASASLMMIVVARPGTVRPVPITSTSSESDDSSSQNSPWGMKIESKLSRNSKTSWSTFIALRKAMQQLSNRKRGSKMVSESSDTIARTVYVWVRQLLHYAEVKNPGIYLRYYIPLVLHLQKILKNNGQMACVMHLKVSLFCLYSYISGNPLKSTMPLGIGIRLSTGLPSVWGKELRAFVREGRLQQIRVLASVMNLYRAMEAPHKDFDVSSIVQQHPNFVGNALFEEFKAFAENEFPKLLKEHSKTMFPFRYESGLGHLVWSAGANSSGAAMAALPRDAKAWFIQPENYALRWFEMHDDNRAVRLLSQCGKEAQFKLGEFDFATASKAEQLAFLKGEIKPVKPTKGNFSLLFWGTRDAFSRAPPPEGHAFDPDEGLHAPILGRLHAIDEPAGKVRVVAICDYWTQVAMKPVHEHLFKILRSIKNDATFDQTGRVDEYFKRGLFPHWSFDLKAATDTIPLALYIEVLTPLLRKEGEDLAESRRRVELWASLLTKRDWLLPNASGFVRYNTGQPMGALSSWASMALVHHALVQFSARRAGRTTWFTEYCVLGDDVDIAKDRLVAQMYQDTCAEFSIIIGLLKSLHSEKNCFEFANQRFTSEGNISPLSIKEELVAQTWSARREFANRILARFGTSLKDQTAALIKKATTEAQWRVLSTELSGARPQIIYNLVRFCLQTPFHNMEGISVESIIKWVGDAVSDGDRVILKTLLTQPHRIKVIERSLTKYIIIDLLKRLRNEVSTAPLPFEYQNTSSGDRLKLFLEPSGKTLFEGNLLLPKMGEGDLKKAQAAQGDLERLLSGFYQGLDFPYRTSKFSVYYLMDCIAKHNEKVLKTMRDLIKRMETLDAYLEHEFTMHEAAKARGKKYPSPFTQVIGIWDEASNLSKLIKVDFGKPLSDYMGVEEMVTPGTGVFAKSYKWNHDPVREALRVPIAPILLCLRETVGVIVPDLPHQPRAGTKGKKWFSLLQRAAASFEANAAVLTQLHRYTTTVLRQVKWLVKFGGRREIPSGF